MGRKSELLNLIPIPRKSRQDYAPLVGEGTRSEENINMATEEPNDDDHIKKLKKDDTTTRPGNIPYPSQIFYIISMEGCERFSYYGMNTILTIYLISLFKRSYSEEKANDLGSIFYHFYKFGCYAFGLLGAALADSYVGKYSTILWLGMIYAVGQATLAVGAVGRGEGGIPNFPNLPVSFIGIILIALGTGGIKPCVVSLGADQFKVPEQAKQMATYFAMFYASINFGSMISTVVTPYLRRVECMGEDSCFFLAFGVPALLMFVAIFFFWFGRKKYRIQIPERNIITLFFKASWHALRRQKHCKDGDHWLDAAGDIYDTSTLADLKAVYRVGRLFLLYPMYWALYDQQGSRWTIQAMQMDGMTFGWQILPDQMQVANPILILALIPLFDRVVYPVLGKFGLLVTPLQRVVTGSFLCGFSFVISGLLELQLLKGYPIVPGSGQGKLLLHNGHSCIVNLSQELSADLSLPQTLAAGESFEKVVNNGSYTLKGTDCKETNFSLSFNISDESSTLLIAESRDKVFVAQSVNNDQIEKDSADPMPFVRLVVSLDRTCRQPITAKLIRGKEEYNLGSGTVGSSWDTKPLKTKHAGQHNLYISCDDQWNFNHSIECMSGASYDVFVTGKEGVSVYEVVPPNSVHIFWLLPQYIVVTIGEILFSITSMEFAYSQAPQSMKSVIQALYLMTTAVGNLITMLIVEIFSALGLHQYLEFFTFAGLMTLVSILLMWMAHRYEYVYYTDENTSPNGIEDMENEMNPEEKIRKRSRIPNSSSP